MKNIKCRGVRFNLLDESLEAKLICSVSELKPGYIKLIKENGISNTLYLIDFEYCQFPIMMNFN